MAMNGNSLGDEIKIAIDGLSDKEDRTAIMRAIGNAIVLHIQTNGDVNLNTVFTQGVPVPNDGGAVLQNTWKVLGAQTGLIS